MNTDSTNVPTKYKPTNKVVWKLLDNEDDKQHLEEFKNTIKYINLCSIQINKRYNCYERYDENFTIHSIKTVFQFK